MSKVVTSLKFERQELLCRPEGKALILVLESPHRNEFEDEPGPAKGTTGRNIALFIRKVRGLEAKSEELLILINAVQYQCSLGHPTTEYRGKVFTAVWKHHGGNDDFKDRLGKIYRLGDTVVCACTKDGKYNLRQLVHTAIREELSNAEVLRRAHPAGWHWPENRAREWNAT